MHNGAGAAAARKWPHARPRGPLGARGPPLLHCLLGPPLLHGPQGLLGLLGLHGLLGLLVHTTCHARRIVGRLVGNAEKTGRHRSDGVCATRMRAATSKPASHMHETKNAEYATTVTHDVMQTESTK